MNIGVLVWKHEIDHGGMQKAACDLVRFLDEQGHVVHIFHNRRRGVKRFEAHYRHPRELCHNLRLEHESPNIERARELVRQQNLDIFISPFSSCNFILIPPLLHNLRIPLIYAEHNDPFIIQNERWNREEHLACASVAERIVLLHDNFRAAYPDFLQDRIAVIPNVVEPATRRATPETANGGAFTLLAAGRLLESHKQFSFLIGAFAALVDTFPDWRLRICGDGPYMQVYTDLATALGIADKISFPGMVEDMSAEYAAAHLFCIPSAYEGFGLVTVEAMSHGLPAVGFADCSGTNCIIKHGHNGMLAPEMTIESLVETLLPLMKNHKLRGLMGKNGINTSKEYLPETIRPKWTNLISEFSAKSGATLLDFPLDRSDAAKSRHMLETILLREDPRKSQSFLIAPTPSSPGAC